MKYILIIALTLSSIAYANDSESFQDFFNKRKQYVDQKCREKIKETKKYIKLLKYNDPERNKLVAKLEIAEQMKFEGRYDDCEVLIPTHEMQTRSISSDQTIVTCGNEDETSEFFMFKGGEKNLDGTDYAAHDFPGSQSILSKYDLGKPGKPKMQLDVFSKVTDNQSSYLENHTYQIADETLDCIYDATKADDLELVPVGWSPVDSPSRGLSCTYYDGEMKKKLSGNQATKFAKRKIADWKKQYPEFFRLTDHFAKASIEPDAYKEGCPDLITTSEKVNELDRYVDAMVVNTALECDVVPKIEVKKDVPIPAREPKKEEPHDCSCKPGAEEGSVHPNVVCFSDIANHMYLMSCEGIKVGDAPKFPEDLNQLQTMSCENNIEIKTPQNQKLIINCCDKQLWISPQGSSKYAIEACNRLTRREGTQDQKTYKNFHEKNDFVTFSGTWFNGSKENFQVKRIAK